MGALRPASLRALDDSLAQPHAIESVETAVRRRPLHVGGRRPRFPSERNVLMELPESSSGLEGIQSRLDEQLAEAQRNMQRAEAFAAQAQDLTAFARSEGGEVSVEVDGGGVPLDVKVTAKAFSLAPEALSQLILDVVRQAHREAVQKYEDLARSVFGDSATTEQLVAQARQRLKAYVRDEGESRFGDRETGLPEAGRVEAGTRETDASDGHTDSPAS